MSATQIANPRLKSEKPSTALTEDWLAVLLGLAIVLVALTFFEAGSSLKWIAVKPPKWSAPGDLTKHFAANADRYVAQFVLWATVFGSGLRLLGTRLSEFLPAFLFLYVGSVVIFVVGAWEQAAAYQLEPPLLALAVGMLLSNLVRMPRWMDVAFRVEYYVKLGIILLGATIPLTLVIWGGPLAILQAGIVSVATFLAIYAVGRRLGLDQRLCATLGVGGAVCGVSASIAVAGAVGARKEHLPVAITLVVVWAVVMVFVLPLAARTLGLSTGVAGAWIGSSEFADAAGFAAAQAYSGYAGTVPGIEGRPEDTIWAFTLMKVVGRDVWIGIWAFVLAIVAATRWECNGVSGRADAGQIWRRFPKFVVGFLLASAIVTILTAGYSYVEFEKQVTPNFVNPVKDLRTWAFIFCFFSIGLSTRFRELTGTGMKPFAAFTAGVALNVLLGFVLSAWVFADHWTNIGHAMSGK